MRVYVERPFGGHSVHVFILVDRPDGTYIMRSHANGSVTQDFFTKGDGDKAENRSPSFIMDHRAARLLVDELSGQGFMPGEVGQIRGELTATKLHLDDMRKIAMAAMELDKPINVEVKS